MLVTLPRKKAGHLRYVLAVRLPIVHRELHLLPLATPLFTIKRPLIPQSLK